jgi:hypothetical protein
MYPILTFSEIIVHMNRGRQIAQLFDCLRSPHEKKPWYQKHDPWQHCRDVIKASYERLDCHRHEDDEKESCEREYRAAFKKLLCALALAREVEKRLARDAQTPEALTV